MIEENNSQKSGTEYLTLRAILAFAKLRQTFSTTLMLYYLIKNFTFGLKLMYQAMTLVKRSII